jgi:hypothetical protein
LYLGATRSLDGETGGKLHVPVDDLATHGVVVGMTGSGKTGLVTVLIEEALRGGVPVLVFDIKGDLPNLLLAFPSFSPEPFGPWLEGYAAPNDARTPAEIAKELAEQRRIGLESWGLQQADLKALHESVDFRVITPGSSAGEGLHILSGLERHSDRWKHDPESARAALGAAVSLVLRLLGRDSDPAKSREHVVLSVFAELRLLRGAPADLGALLEDLAEPPVDRIGALPIDDFLPRSERRALAAALNTLLASPTFASWREGVTLDIGAWLTPSNGRTPGVIVSTAHLDDEERALVLGVLLEELLSWVRTLPGSQRLRALIVFDEVYGFLPPHPANPPTKRPLVALLKQARAFGVGVLVATQNPMDLDYRALSNAGLWAIGRLQTDADRARVLEGLAGGGSNPDDDDEGQAPTASELGSIVKRLAPRWFLLRSARSGEASALLQVRWALSWMRGPMTRTEIRKARALHPRSPARAAHEPKPPSASER